MFPQVCRNVTKPVIAFGRYPSCQSRSLSTAALTRDRTDLLHNNRNNVQIQQFAYISKNANNKTTITAETIPSVKSRDDVAAAAATASTTGKRNWISFGFSQKSEDEDINNRNGVMFFTVTLLLVMGSFFLGYFPDYKLRNWAQREAFIELARREALGLPLIDPNLVPPEKVNLPSEEELGDFDIVI